MRTPTSIADAAERIGAAFEDLRGCAVRPFGSGWDNVAFLVDDEWLFRFPRREAARPYLEREVRWLPPLAARLPLPVSAAARVGRDPDLFAGYRLLPGRSADATTELDARAAAALGRFVAALHGADASVGPGPLPDVIGKRDLRVAALALRHRVERARRAGRTIDADAVVARAEAWSRAPETRRCWVHGDLYPRHVLLDDEGAPCGVVDWGDLHVGDPALDLSLAFGWLKAPTRAAFLDAYGPVDEATERRAFFRVLYYGVVLDDVGSELGDADLRALGAVYLARALERDIGERRPIRSG